MCSEIVAASGQVLGVTGAFSGGYDFWIAVPWIGLKTAFVSRLELSKNTGSRIQANGNGIW